MFDWLGRLFGTDKAATSLIDNISNGLDKIYYSDEEKADNKLKAQEQASGLLIDWLSSTQGSNLARRIIALSVTAIWALQYLAAMLMLAFVPWVDTQTTVEALTQSAASFKESGAQIDGAMMLVLGFYFAAPHLSTIVNTAMNKFSGKKE